MAIIEYRCGTTPREIINRIKRRNDKESLASTMHQLWITAYDEQLTDEQARARLKELLSYVV